MIYNLNCCNFVKIDKSKVCGTKPSKFRLISPCIRKPLFKNRTLNIENDCRNLIENCKLYVRIVNFVYANFLIQSKMTQVAFQKFCYINVKHFFRHTNVQGMTIENLKNCVKSEQWSINIHCFSY